MGAARLLAKGWTVFCVYAGGLALARAAAGGVPLGQAFVPVLVCVLLFGAMGVLFIAGYGLSASHLRPMLPDRFDPAAYRPGFNETVFLAFIVIVFCLQMFYAPAGPATPAIAALESAVRFAVFGQGRLESVLTVCGLGGSRLLVSAVSWLLALVFLGSALSRLRLAAGVLRLERKRRPEALGAQPLAFAVGIVAVIGIQLFYVGTAWSLIPCRLAGGLLGDAVIGLAPLMLGYLIMAALVNLLALGPEA
ncbi:MAG: hypothetical protein ACREHF_07405 [Rhizomicrobium sp.]